MKAMGNNAKYLIKGASTILFVLNSGVIKNLSYFLYVQDVKLNLLSSCKNHNHDLKIHFEKFNVETSILMGLLLGWRPKLTASLYKLMVHIKTTRISISKLW